MEDYHPCSCTSSLQPCRYLKRTSIPLTDRNSHLLNLKGPLSAEVPSLAIQEVNMEVDLFSREVEQENEEAGIILKAR